MANLPKPGVADSSRRSTGFVAKSDYTVPSSVPIRGATPLWQDRISELEATSESEEGSESGREGKMHWGMGRNRLRQYRIVRRSRRKKRKDFGMGYESRRDND